MHWLLRVTRYWTVIPISYALVNVAIYINKSIFADVAIYINKLADAFCNVLQGMGRAGKALNQVLQTFKIKQSKLAVALEIDRAVVNRWVHEQVDPNAETVVAIVLALKSIDFNAAEVFIQLYLVDLMKHESDEIK